MTNSNPTRSVIAGTVFAAVLALPLSFAHASSQLNGTSVGQTAEEITANLVAQGYEIRKVKSEDGLLEVYALKGDMRYEIYVDTATGKVTKVKEEN